MMPKPRISHTLLHKYDSLVFTFKTIHQMSIIGFEPIPRRGL